ncbi:T9SS type A sorting domain-containing protein, partial [bacterium]|nr:T9SS type A sorting domain-containing protein [bacterium]
RMVDKDGSMKYSDEKTVKIASGNGDLWMSEVLPNPVQSELKVRVNVGENSAEMIIYDLNGRELKHLAVSNNGIEQEIRIDVSNMVPGTYTLAMKSGEKVTITRQFTIVR